MRVSHFAQKEENKVYYPPYPHPSERNQLQNPEPHIVQVKPINPKTTQEERKAQGENPVLVALPGCLL